ncbi:MAG: carboxypeptidase-like regulatory domain-containing protein, partial [Balneolaceae bacterium]
MKLKRSILLWLLAIGFSAAVPSHANTIVSSSALPEEDGTVSGVVYDRETSEPLGHAYLFLEELNRSAISHADGTFEFRNVPEGTYTLIVQRLGYRTVNQTIEVQADETTHLEISVQPTV